MSSLKTVHAEDRADLDIVEARRALATLGMHYQRLSRQFQKAVDKICEIQADCSERERDLKRAAAHRACALPQASNHRPPATDNQ